MASGPTEREILEEKLERRLLDPKTEPLISLPLNFLEDITCGFSTERVLGEGLSGVVYKGVLRSGKTIAVKKISDIYLMNNVNRVENEIICHKDVRHQNVVQLVGYCFETKPEENEYNGKHVAERSACLLCFEFFCKGSLEKYLSENTSVFDWDKRYKIIRGVCRGLHYLHDKCRIVHRDLKPQNILMDDMMMPKIANFYLSRLLGEQKSRTVTQTIRGTFGYMAPEYINSGSISFKADIFSLGVLIIELIKGKGCRDYPKTGERTETSLRRYTDEVVKSLRNRTPMHMSPEIHIKQVEKCISIALKCLEPESNKRPTSLEIVQDLDALEPEPGSPGNSPSDPEKDRRNQNLESQLGTMDMINIPNNNSAANSLNECANSFQWSDHQYLIRDSLPRVIDLIDRAEWRTHVKCVSDLLPKLKDAMYDAEDLVDEFEWYKTKVSIEGNATSVPVTESFSGVTQGGFNRVTDIKNRLDHLSGELEKVGSLQPIPRFGKSVRPETTSFRTEEKIFGRDKEKTDIIRLLGVLTKNSTDPSGSKRKRSEKFVHDTENNKLIRLPGVPTKNSTDPSGSNRKTSGVHVLPIVGIGGVGKTTLAQDICNHSKVKRHFDTIIWICVSDDFDVKRLTKEVIEQSSSRDNNVPKTDNLNLLQRALEKSLESKRFLLVLDDMWDENKRDWRQFCAPFRDAANGSMMLVTTRSLKVAHVVRTNTMDPFPLKGLNQEVFWEFFKFCVFGSDSTKNYPELERIGKEILPKLKGSPLAAKTIGWLLATKLDIAHWDTILKSQLWELTQKDTDILLALRLSYMYLPFHLKRCLSFCAVYPKDEKFKKEDLAEIWEAQGLVPQHTGDQYFEELAQRSFFEKCPRSPKYVIHDLIHDMAQLVSKDECFIVKDTKDISKIPHNVHHLLVLKGGDVKCDDLLNLGKHKKLRTLVCNLSLKSKTGNIVMEKWCAELMHMRVMVCSSISNWGLPHSISNMKQLRYLKILDSCACKSLPAEFCRLYNMQFFCAKKWEIDDIPSGFGMLINLQKFESKGRQQFHRTHSGRITIFQYLPNITSLGVDHRENVNSISFQSHNSTEVQILGCQNLSSVEQFLQPTYVPKIKRITISDCINLESVLTEKFGDFRFLEELYVYDCPNIKSQRLFAPSLKGLYLSDSGGFIDNIECSSLTTFHISGHPTKSIELKMWNLPSLQELKISSCHSLTIIRDSEAFSADLFHSGAATRMVKFPASIKSLELRNCAKLKSIGGPEAIAHIKDICIENCPELKEIHRPHE